MTKKPLPPSNVLGRVDALLQTEAGARSLALAFRLGWIDRLAAGPVALADLGFSGSATVRTLPFLIDILASAGVVSRNGETMELTAEFADLLAFRDLIEGRLWFASLAAADVHKNWEALMTDLPAFMACAQTFELFRYDRCVTVTPENLEATRRWLSYTTVLTKYEAPAALDLLSSAQAGRMLDVGGNSGEFVRQACSRNPELRATVFDLPVVCALGREHLVGTEEAERITFVEGDMRTDPLPPGHDLLTFKSVLHDWPDEAVSIFLRKAHAALPPGGMLAIFERDRVEVGAAALSYAMAANLVFLPFFRGSSFYVEQLSGLGFQMVGLERVVLDMPFFLILARKAEG